jgi:hypothetical protein
MIDGRVLNGTGWTHVYTPMDSCLRSLLPHTYGLAGYTDYSVA